MTQFRHPEACYPFGRRRRPRTY